MTGPPAGPVGPDAKCWDRKSKGRCSSSALWFGVLQTYDQAELIQ
jgi:hypothetical protein